MSKIVRCGLIQCSNPINDETKPVAVIQKAMLDKHIPFIEDAGKKGVQILGLQEIFNGPYFCPGQDPRWYEAAEAVPGPMVELMSTYAKKYNMVMVVPVPNSGRPVKSAWAQVQQVQASLTNLTSPRAERCSASPVVYGPIPVGSGW